MFKKLFFFHEFPYNFYEKNLILRSSSQKVGPDCVFEK